MDVEDVSDVRDYILMLEQQKKTLQEASKRKGERPQDRIPRAKAINDQNQMSLRNKMMKINYQANDNVLMHSSFLAPPYLPSTARLEDLGTIYIKDLQLETHHRGFYLVLRVVSLPTRMTAIMVAMEDDNEDAITVQMYHQKDEKERKTEDIVQYKAVCVIKEPYFKIMSDGNYGVRIDHITDLIWLPHDDDKIPLLWRPRFQELDKTADKWRQEGNAAVNAKDYSKAVLCYTSALKCCRSIEERRLILNNRSLASFKLGCYDAAFADADCTLTKAQESEKSLYRAAQAMYELGRLQECHSFLQILLQDYPHSEPGKSQMRRVAERLKEQKHGDYNFQNMYSTIKSTSPILDCATFVGPVTVKDSSDRGRGLFTVREVKAGDLLLCEKAFAASYSEMTPKGIKADPSILMNLHTNRITLGTHGALITAIIHRLKQNPSLIPAFVSLYHGSYETMNITKVDDTAVIDTFLVAQIVTLNVFGCPLTSLESQFPNPHSKLKSSEYYHSCGIWLLASRINHSCIKNASRSFIGDMQIIRATCDIPASTEITFWYHIPVMESHFKKQEALLQTWGFKCNCAMCLEESKTPKPVTRKREALISDIDNALEPSASSSSSGADISKIERLLAALEQTYNKAPPPTDIPRLAPAIKWALVTRLYASYKRPDEVISAALRSLQSLGYIIRIILPSSSATEPPIFEVQRWGLLYETVLGTFLQLWIAAACVDLRVGKMVEKYVRVVYGMCLGEVGSFDDGTNGEIERIRGCAYE